MAISRQSLEQKFFRGLNRFVEPAVRAGVGSPRYAPGGMIVLETTGFKSGATRRTPLLATRLGHYTLISTVRGERSFWIKNLQKDAHTRYYLGGKARDAQAFVIAPGTAYKTPQSLPAIMGWLSDKLAPLTNRGWAFVILAP